MFVQHKLPEKSQQRQDCISYYESGANLQTYNHHNLAFLGTNQQQTEKSKSHPHSIHLNIYFSFVIKNKANP
jgi:hypothetical protein